MKKLTLTIVFALLLVQLAVAPGGPITGKLSYGDVNLPSGTVKGYNLSMDSGFISVLGESSSAVYFTVTNDVLQPKFYRKTLDGVVEEFGVPLNNEPGSTLRSTSAEGDASDVAINELPYYIAYGDSSDFGLLEAGYEGSMYVIAFGGEQSNGAMKITNIPGKVIYLFNSQDGRMLFLADENAILNLNNMITITFRAPNQGQGNANANAGNRVGRAGVMAEVESVGCTDVDSPEANQFTESSYGFDETGTILSDFCAVEGRTSKRVLNEVKCGADNRVYLEEHNCADGEVCRNGACRPEQQQEVAFCYDTDMEGINGPEHIDIVRSDLLAEVIASKGAVAGFYAAGRNISYGLWDDYCVPGTNRLAEYYCVDRKTRFATIVCGSGCSEGKCDNPPYCFDADGGENPGTKGRTLGLSIDPNLNEFDPNYMNLWDYLISNVNNDTCINSTALREFSCENTGQVKEQVITCENGCAQGRCLREGESIEIPKACTTRNDCNFSQACIESASTKSGYYGISWECYDGTSQAAVDESCKISSELLATATSACEGRCNAVSGKCGVNSYSMGSSCENAGSVEGICGPCSTARDCGTGWTCSSGNCRLASGRCKTSLNCKINQECDIGQGQELGYCQNEGLTNLEKVRGALERRWARVNAYARIILRFEGLHNLALPPKQSNGQTCFVDSQCNSEYCDPQQGKCASSPNDTLRRIAGEHCTRELQCYSKYEPIVQNACRGNPYACYDPLPNLNANEQKRGVGRTCRAGSQCLANACNIGICGRKKGQSCTNSDQCLSGDCTSGKCGLSNPKSIDQNDLCSYDNDCIEGYKCSKFHRCVTPQDLKNYNRNCAYNMGCLSGSCVNGKCAKSENNGLCENNTDCTSNVCSASRCAPSNLKSVGESCGYDNECASNKCSYPNPAVPVKKCMEAVQ